MSAEQWRASIPFTNKQIADAVAEEAYAAPNEFLASKYINQSNWIRRTGRITSRLLGFALPRLVTLCGICGSPALYRYGTDGRCRKHRLVLTDSFRAKLARMESVANEMEQTAADSDARTKNLNRLRQLHRATLNRLK